MGHGIDVVAEALSLIGIGLERASVSLDPLNIADGWVGLKLGAIGERSDGLRACDLSENQRPKGRHGQNMNAHLSLPRKTHTRGAAP
jgi:hypothetical protein